ncbi:RAMP superfamily CRISPR-associated protein [Acetivibrio straminisolvens]|jgi:hypothetical protein|uniref:CRISPR type III-associated protein domain-containing protein n=1 Tax=Acetivibrio straminisolvens JCM 21531 TaxID=1294263 RepID=W4VCB5_9FIRM|nr:RAMP superfamily CRISPR-associated protein [Acetivibrio straminisolvens]GAE90408.1 hypothetical protein JCM21531_4018 [Acetivibrio straminisolvens JCM 21531]
MYKYSVIEIRNLEPLKIGAIGRQSKYSEPSTDYIPGSTIRGAIIAQLIKSGLFNDESKNDFLLGMECYNAYPYAEGHLYLPIPMHLRVDKHEWRKIKKTMNNDGEITLADLFEVESKIGESKIKNYPEYSFVTEENGCLRGIKIAKEYRLHHSTTKNRLNEDAEKNNKENDNSRERENLFRYQAISVGQVFRGIIKYNLKIEEQMRDLFKEKRIIYLGGSKGSGYGKSEMECLSESLTDFEEVKKTLGIKLDLKDNDEKKNEENEKNEKEIKELVITCLSDCIFRDKYGQPIGELPECYFKKVTNKKAELKNKFVKTGCTEGYNTTWKARYPKETTLKAGSTLKYTFSEALNSDELKKLKEYLEEKLIGSRTQDGYGWLMVNVNYPKKMFIKEKRVTVNFNNGSNIDLDSILSEDERRATFNVLLNGMGEAKKRWLNMLCFRYFENAGNENYIDNSDERFYISDKLNTSQLKNMEDIVDKWLNCDNQEQKKLIDSEEIKFNRSYYRIDEYVSVAGQNFYQVMEYLCGRKPNNEMLESFAEKKLNTQQGKLFYFDKENKERNKEFIADLLKHGLYIKRRGGI